MERLLVFPRTGFHVYLSGPLCFQIADSFSTTLVFWGAGCMAEPSRDPGLERRSRRGGGGSRTIAVHSKVHWGPRLTSLKAHPATDFDD